MLLEKTEAWQRLTLNLLTNYNTLIHKNQELFFQYEMFLKTHLKNFQVFLKMLLKL